jgi:hypothetical protein
MLFMLYDSIQSRQPSSEMSDSLPNVAQAAPLTDALRRAGVLGDGSVREAVVESVRPTVLSRIIRLRLAYDGSANDAPSSLILKIAHPDRMGPNWGAGRNEVAFYNRVAAAAPGLPLPRCFEAQWDEATGTWHILLEDLTESHMVATAWPVPPSMEQCGRIVAAFARLHAVFWDDARLGDAIGAWADDAALDHDRQIFAERYARFADRVGDNLSPPRRALYEKVITTWPRLIERYRSRRHLTIVHGDAHAWNCFLPRDGAADDARLFDFDSWRIDAATDDLAYMMAMHWYPERRRRMERALLDRYHVVLGAHGVRGYDRAMLDDDYRLSVLWLMQRPVVQSAIGIPPVIWWNNLERILLAVDDLDCRALLG